MNKSFEDYLTYIEGLKQYSSNTLLAYKNNLSIFEKWLSESDVNIFSVSANDIRMFVSFLSYKDFSSATINQALSTIRGFYDFAVRFKLIDFNPTDSVKNVKMSYTLPDFLFTDEMVSFCKTPDAQNKLWPERDKALFLSLYSTGCRVSELVQLNIKDLSSDMKTAIVWGKGSKERKVFFASQCVQVLKDYLAERNKTLETLNKNEIALFINKRGSRLTQRGVQYIIQRYSEYAGNYKKITPHTFRHSFASTLLTKGLDIRVVQELLGHSSISTTQKYTHITSEQLKNLYHNSHPHGRTKLKEEIYEN